jgi:O-antigen ligase
MDPIEQKIDRRHNLIAMLLIGAAIVIGGGGSPAAYPELALQLWSAALLAAWALLSPEPLPQVSRPAWLIAGLLLLLPAIQLVPLPPALWHQLPGRELERAALALVGQENSWRPWSLTPARTMASLLALVTPVIMLVFTASLRRAGRGMVLGMIAGTALLALIVGAGQMGGGDANVFRFYVPDMSYLNGFQANHNSAADVLMIGMVAFAAVVREGAERGKFPARPAYLLAAVGGAALLFSVGVVLTASRAGTALLPVALAWVVVIVWPWLHFTRRNLIALGLLALLAGAAVFYLIETNGVLARVLSRYAFAGEFRPQLWADTLYAAQQYFPMGTGLGSFTPVFIAIERLEVVDVTMPNRAHSDGLELLLEGGVFGLLILAVIATILFRKFLRALKNPPTGGRAPVYFAGAALSIIALHSQVDYPLRSMSLACLAAAAAGMLMPLARQRAIA